MVCLELNKVYKWEEIVKAYPNMYALITNIKEYAGEIKSCKLLDVCTADERAEYVQKYMHKNIKLKCQKTTCDGDPNINYWF